MVSPPGFFADNNPVGWHFDNTYSRLPEVLRWIAYATPSWHGVDLCRSLTLGRVHWPLALGHVVYLAAWAVAGLACALYTYRRRLLK